MIKLFLMTMGFVWIARTFGWFRIPPRLPHESVDPYASVDDPYARERMVLRAEERANRAARQPMQRPPHHASSARAPVASAQAPAMVGRAGSYRVNEYGEVQDEREAHDRAH